jgi:hypothetical protein
MDGDPISFAMPEGVSPQGRIIDLDFVGNSNAWASIKDGSRGKLVSTTDGGKTSKFMSSPVEQPLVIH